MASDRKDRPAPVTLHIRARVALWTLLAAAAALVAASALGRLLRWYVFEPGSVGDRAALMLDVNLEHNLPTFYATGLLLACTPLLAYVALAAGRQGRGWRLHWSALAAGFVLLALDEAVELHGRLNAPVAAAVKAGGVFTYAWVIPAVVLLAAIAAAYAPFLAALPQATRRRFLAAGAIYVIGAVGLEMVAGYLVSDAFQASETRRYALATLSEHVEELLEMTGVSLFIYALLKHVGENLGGLRLSAQVD